MIVRILAICMTIGAIVAFWFGYDQLKQFRGTPFWDYRYIVFAVAAFLGLSILEQVMGWIKTKIEGDSDTH